MKKSHQIKYGKKVKIPPYVWPRAFFRKRIEPRIETLEEVGNRRKLKAKGIKTEIERILYAVQNAKVKKFEEKR